MRFEWLNVLGIGLDSEELNWVKGLGTYEAVWILHVH